MRCRLIAAFLVIAAAAWADSPKSVPVTLIFKGDKVQPMFPLQFKVEQESGPPVQNGVLKCRATEQKRVAVVDGKVGEVKEIVFECADKRRFVIREVLFTEDKT